MKLEQKQIQRQLVPEPIQIDGPAFRQYARNRGFNPDEVPVSAMRALQAEWQKSKEKKADDLWARERSSEARLFQEMRTRGGWEDFVAPVGFQIVEEDD